MGGVGVVKGGQEGQGPEKALSLQCLPLLPSRLSSQEAGGDSVSVGEWITVSVCLHVCLRVFVYYIHLPVCLSPRAVCECV